MRVEVVYSEAAEQDLDDIFDYLAIHADLLIADRMIDAIVEQCNLLGHQPEMGRRRSELDVVGLEVRSIRAVSWLIFYTKRMSAIEILRVLHQARDVDESLMESS